LLKTPIIGRLTAPVASSCIDIEAGLSKCDMIRTPPDFCASATGTASASDNANAATNLSRFSLIADTSPGGRSFSWSGSWAELCWRTSTPAAYTAAGRGAIPEPVPKMGACTSAASRLRCNLTRLAAMSWQDDIGNSKNKNGNANSE